MQHTVRPVPAVARTAGWGRRPRYAAPSSFGGWRLLVLYSQVMENERRATAGPDRERHAAPRPEARRNGGHLVRSLHTLSPSRRLMEALGPLVRDPEADSTRTAA